MMRQKKFDFRTAYIDLLINVLTGMVFLFMITTLLIQTKTKPEDDGPRRDAQYVLTIHWDPALDCDVDLWVQDPADGLVSFQHKDVNVMHLEHDDRGFRSDIVTGENGIEEVKNNNNEETWVLRGKLPGEYYANVHLYACRIDNKQYDLGEIANIDVSAELIQINPKFARVAENKVRLVHIWEEQTILHFKIKEDGNFGEVLPGDKDLVREVQP